MTLSDNLKWHMRSVWETMAWDIFDSMATEGRPPECTQEEVIELVLMQTEWNSFAKILNC